MVFTNWGFSVVRNWMLGTNPAPPSGALVGTGSSTVTFSDLLLGSPLYPTWHAFSSQSGIGFTAQLEHLVLAGDITLGSVTREFGVNATSGGNLFMRSLIPETSLNGSVQINSFVIITVN